MLGKQLALTKSRQLYHLDLEGGVCELAAPDSTLSAYIDYYWLLSIEQPSLVLQVIPDTAVDLVISPDIPEFAALYFPVSEKFDIKLEGPIHYAGVCFRSTAAPDLLQAELNALTQLTLGSDVIRQLDIKPLLAQIQTTYSMKQLVSHFDSFWMSRVASRDNSEKMKARISHHQLIKALENSVGCNSIATICQTLDISERQFRRLSNDLFGFSPKKLQNILRLQSALDELLHCEQHLFRDLYYDDSHRIRELKRLTGFTPKQIRQMAEKYNKL